MLLEQLSQLAGSSRIDDQLSLGDARDHEVVEVEERADVGEQRGVVDLEHRHVGVQQGRAHEGFQASMVYW